MSWKAEGWAWSLPIPSVVPTQGARLVLIALAHFAGNETHECWPGQATLAEMCGMTERGVRKILAELVERGLIERQGRWRKGHRISDLYRLRIPPDWASGPARPENQPEPGSGKGAREPEPGSGREPVNRNVVPSQPERGSGEPSVEPSDSKPPPQSPSSARAAAVDRFLELRSELWPHDPSFPASLDTLKTQAADLLPAEIPVARVVDCLERGMRAKAARGGTPPVNLKAFRLSLGDLAADWRAESAEPASRPTHSGGAGMRYGEGLPPAYRAAYRAWAEAGRVGAAPDVRAFR